MPIFLSASREQSLPNEHFQIQDFNSDRVLLRTGWQQRGQLGSQTYVVMPMKFDEIEPLPPGMKLVLEEDRAVLEFPLEMVGSVVEALPQIRVESPSGTMSVSPPPALQRTAAAERLVHLTPQLGPTWFTFLSVLYDLQVEQPDSVVPLGKLAERMQVGHQTAYRYVRNFRLGSIQSEEADRIVRHFLVAVSAAKRNTPYQFQLRNLDEALGTFPS